MKTQYRKAKKHHSQINEGFVRYSFSEYVHKHGDEQFDEFLTGARKALGDAWSNLTSLRGGTPRASAPTSQPAAPAARPAAAQAPAQKPSSFTPDQSKIASRNVHMARVEGAFGNVHKSLLKAKQDLGWSIDNVIGVLQKSGQGEDMRAMASLNQYVKKYVPSLKTQIDAKLDKMIARFDPAVKTNLQGEIRQIMKDKWKLLDDATPNDVSRSGNMIRAQETNPEGGAPRGSGSAQGVGSLRGQIDKSADSYFDRISAR